jgi:response regulator of citrate/malate metabolism
LKLLVGQKIPPEAIEMLRILNTELAIVDIEMPGTIGIDLLRENREKKIGCKEVYGIEAKSNLE